MMLVFDLFSSVLDFCKLGTLSSHDVPTEPRYNDINRSISISWVQAARQELSEAC